MNKLEYTSPNDSQDYQIGDLFEVKSSSACPKRVVILSQINSLYALVCLDNGAQWATAKRTAKDAVEVAQMNAHCRFLGRNMTISLS